MSSAERVAGVLQEVYAAGHVDDDAGERRPVHPHGVTAEQGADLAELVVREGAARTLEVGFALGLSCLHLCLGLLRAGAPDAHHVAIDPTEGPYWRNAGLRLVERAGLGDTVELIEQESQLALPRLVTEGREHSFDIAFVDGDHRFDPAFVDLFFAVRLVRPGGLILVDDMWMPAVRTVVAFFERNLGLELLPDAVPGAFRWGRRRPWRSGVPQGTGSTAVLRRTDLGDRPWDHFVPFA